MSLYKMHQYELYETEISDWLEVPIIAYRVESVLSGRQEIIRDRQLLKSQLSCPATV